MWNNGVSVPMSLNEKIIYDFFKLQLVSILFFLLFLFLLCEFRELFHSTFAWSCVDKWNVARLLNAKWITQGRILFTKFTTTTKKSLLLHYKLNPCILGSRFAIKKYWISRQSKRKHLVERNYTIFLKLYHLSLWP